MGPGMTVDIGRSDFGAFFDAPFAVYGDSPHVSPFKADLERFLDKTKNPLFADPGSDLVFFLPPIAAARFWAGSPRMCMAPRTACMV